MLIYFYGHFQFERARPNSSFLHIGSAVRKAVAAGLHKGVCSRTGQSQDDSDQRCILFWSLFFWETSATIPNHKLYAITDNNKTGGNAL